MYRITDEDRNAFYTKDYSLALAITKDKNNPFINFIKTNEKVDKRHIIETMEDFENYFY